MKKPATTAVKIDELIASRWSPRAFDPDFLINDDKVNCAMFISDNDDFVLGQIFFRYNAYIKDDKLYIVGRVLRLFEIYGIPDSNLIIYPP